MKKRYKFVLNVDIIDPCDCSYPYASRLEEVRSGILFFVASSYIPFAKISLDKVIDKGIVEEDKKKTSQ